MSFPRYSKYKDSDVEWLGEVPEHWEVVPLKHLASLKGRLGWQGLRADEYTDDGPFLVTSEHFASDKIDWHRCYHVPVDRYEMAPEIQLRPNDLLMMKDGAAMGKLAYVDQLPGPACLNSHLLLFRPLNGRFETRFLYFVLSGPSFKSYMIQERTGTTFFGISQESIGAFPLMLPPIKEQDRIHSFLDRETAKIDALVAVQGRLIELLKEKRQAVISHAVTKGLNPAARMRPSGIEWPGTIPENWRVKKLKYLVARSSGIQMGPFGGMLLNLDATDTGYRVYGQENTISGDFSLGQRWISETRFNEMSNYHLRDGDIVLTRKGSVGNARLISQLPQPGICDSDTIRLQVNEHQISSKFLTLLLHNAPYVAQQIALNKRGAILAGLNTETIAMLSVVVPPRNMQDSVLSYVESQTKFIDKGIDVCEQSIELMQERRTTLISAAVTGKIDVRGLNI